MTTQLTDALPLSPATSPPHVFECLGATFLGFVESRGQRTWRKAEANGEAGVELAELSVLHCLSELVPREPSDSQADHATTTPGKVDRPPLGVL